MNDDPAFARYIAINLARFGGVLLVMLGIAIMQGVFELPKWTGLLVAFLGVAEVFVVPRILAGRWRSPDE